MKFAEFLQQYRVVLDKSQIPTIKKAKENVLIKVQTEWQAVSGKTKSVNKFSKKVNNMKTKNRKQSRNTMRVLNHSLFQGHGGGLNLTTPKIWEFRLS